MNACLFGRATRATRAAMVVKELRMPVCEVCGNDYDKAFEVIAAGQRRVFDSFECAVQKMAPVCEHCGCKVLGHGAEVDGRFYCCAHCARQSESTAVLADRVG